MATKRQIEQAGRLWGLALIAHMDLSGDSAPEVREAAITQAQQELMRRGYDYSQLINEEDCLQAICARTRDRKHA